MLAAGLLCVLLSHPVHAVRVAADDALAAMGYLAAPALTAAAASTDPERVNRAARLLDNCRATLADWMLAGGVPYLDAHLDWVSSTLSSYVSIAAEQGHPMTRGADWPAYRHATRLWLADRLAEGVPVAELRGVLAVMWTRTICYDRCRKWAE